MKRIKILSALVMLWGMVAGCPKAKLHPAAMAAQNACVRAANQGKLELAENYCRLALRYNPKFAEAHNGLALVDIQRGALGKAEGRLKKALSINSNFADARSNLGHIYFLRKDYKRAQYLFRTALDIDPKLLNAGYNMSRTLILTRRYKQARDQIIQSIFFPSNRRFPPFHFLLGFIEFERKDYKKAIKHFLDAVQLDPNYVAAHLNLCKALYLISQYGAACFHCKQVLRVSTDHVDGKRSLAAVNQKLQEYGKSCHQSLQTQ